MNVLRARTTVTWTMPTAPTPLVASPALVSLDSLVMELTAQVSNALLVTAACEVPLYTLRHWWVWPWYWQLSPKCHMYGQCWKLWVQMWSRVHWKWSRLFWWVYFIIVPYCYYKLISFGILTRHWWMWAEHRWLWEWHYFLFQHYWILWVFVSAWLCKT